MALIKKEAPEFDVDDELLLMEPGIVFGEVQGDEVEAPVARTKAKNATPSKQHKYIDYTRALDATQSTLR